MITVGELAEKIGGEVQGEHTRRVTGVCSLSDVERDCVTFLNSQRDAVLLEGKNPAAVICGRTMRVSGFTLIRADNPKLAFALAIDFFHPREKPAPGIHPSAVVDAGAFVDDSATVGPNCCVVRGAKIGAGTVLTANVYIGANAVVGRDCLLYPNVCLLERCEIGDNVVLHSGVVIGSDGFGFVRDGRKYIKVPQVGRVVIGDGVEIGANSVVDRATLGATLIGRGTKIDNLVQIGHNVEIGEDVIICGCVGISGSARIGDRVILGGQAGVSDHVKIGDDAILGARAGVVDNVPPGAFYSGFPARPHRENMKSISAVNRLPEIIKKLETGKARSDSSE